MIKETKQRVYEPPQARDLSAYGAVGGNPEGACESGSYPYYNCSTGTIFGSGCVPGSFPDTSSCVFGGYHTRSQCNYGGSAAVICISGSHQS
jgi:hypothetical protein